MEWLELRIPPPLQAAGVAGLMWAISAAITVWTLPIPQSVSLALFVVGAVVSALGVIEFKKAQTTVNPLAPQEASSLVMTGIYRWSRNPMYVGLGFVLLGWACWLANGVAFLMLPLFVLSINRLQIVPEERHLQAKFGDEFADYSTKVRRWI
ncbi:MAG: isoprenylcysteine carboxylmethyltransferase family protein [Coleofasciculaceae cyanobacterium RL_1_1]|nr:isoprenylcysteine carboxylmethyltransferase family protein [Coleofasciculaceae cyanobacterium RL_1_1]